MKKKFIYVLIILPFLVSCNFKFNGIRGNGNVTTETREVGTFEKLDLSGNYDVEITNGETSLQITAEENLIPYIKTKVKNNTLIVYNRKSISPRKDMKIKITTPQLIAIDCSGANDINARNIDVENFSIDLSGAGSITINGKTEKFNVDISGAADLEADEFIAEEVNLDISGAASARVYAAKIFNVEASGASSIKVYGNPDKVNQDISGISSFEIVKD